MLPESAQVEALIQGLGSDYWRLTPATMAAYLSRGKWKAVKHLLYISRCIAHDLEQGGARIIVSMPPRHGKSELISHWTPIWVADRHPEWPQIMTSYGAELSVHFSRRVRDAISEYEEEGLLRCHLNPNLQRSDSFGLVEGGGVLAAGVNGPITGRGAMLLTIDDYLKNAKDAASPQIRQDQWDWFISVVNTRLEPHGNIIICATRWNIDDIIGRILQKQRTGDFQDLDGDGDHKRWRYIKLPAVAVDYDPLDREPGDILWEERYDLERLMEIQSDMGGQGAYFWAALFQQEPIPRSAGLVKPEDFQYFDGLPHYSRLIKKVRAWDLASTPEKGDWTVGTALCIDKPTERVLCIDQKAGQWGPRDLDKVLLKTAEEDGASTRIVIEQEPGSSGKIAAEHFKALLRGYAVECVRTTGDKFTRAQPLMGCIQDHNFYLLRGHWNSLLINEAMLFPDAQHDDRVDSAALAFSKVYERKYTGVTWGRKAPTIEGKAVRVEDDTPEKRHDKKARLILGTTWRT